MMNWHGFECRKAKGSHRIFKRGNTKIVIVWRKPHVHSKAVKEALAVIDSLSEPGEIA